MNEPDEIEEQLKVTLAQRAESVHVSSERFDPNRAALLGRDAPGSGLPTGSARGRRLARSAVVAAAAVVLLAVGFVAARSNGSGSGELRAGAAPSGSVGTHTTTAMARPVTVESLNGLFVATSAEFNGTMFARSWLSYSSWAVQVGASRCLEDEGSPYRTRVDPSVPPWATRSGSMHDNTQFPDIAELKTGTFVGEQGGTSAPPAGPTTTVDGLAYSAAVNECLRQAGDPYKDLAAKVNLFVAIWGDPTRGLDADPKVVAARVIYVACMADRGIIVTSGGSNGVGDTDVFGLADEAQRNGDSTRVAQLAKAYGTCFAPVSDAMDDYRLARRAEFYEKYSTQLQQLAVDIDHAEAQLSAEYGIPRP